MLLDDNITCNDYESFSSVSLVVMMHTQCSCGTEFDPADCPTKG